MKVQRSLPLAAEEFTTVYVYGLIPPFSVFISYLNYGLTEDCTLIQITIGNLNAIKYPAEAR